MDKTFTERFMEAAKAEGLLDTKKQAVSLRETMIAALDEAVNRFAENQNPTIIRADITIMEVTDPATGCIFRRELPMEFLETATGIKIKGEDYYGKPSEIAFLSGNATMRIKDLMGGGAEHDSCGGHTPS